MRLEAIPLSTLALVRSGGGAPQDPSAFTTTGFPFVRAGSLPKLLDGEDEDRLEKLERRVAEGHGLSLFPAGTVVFAKSGMSATKGYVYRLKAPAYVVNHLAALIPHAPEDSAFLVRVLQRFSPTVLIKDPAYPSIRLGDIENMMVLAPLDSSGRRRIAEILDKADALRAKRRAALAQLDTLTQSIFLDMFGDPATNPKGWPVQELDDIAGKITDGEHLNPQFSSSGMPIVMAGDVLDDSVEIESAKKVDLNLGVRFRRKCDPDVGDLLLVSRGATIGRQCVVDTDRAFCLMGSVILIKRRKDSLESRFLSAYLKHPAVRASLYRLFVEVSG